MNNYYFLFAVVVVVLLSSSIVSAFSFGEAVGSVGDFLWLLKQKVSDMLNRTVALNNSIQTIFLIPIAIIGVLTVFWVLKHSIYAVLGIIILLILFFFWMYVIPSLI